MVLAICNFRCAQFVVLNICKLWFRFAALAVVFVDELFASLGSHEEAWDIHTNLHNNNNLFSLIPSMADFDG